MEENLKNAVMNFKSKTDSMYIDHFLFLFESQKKYSSLLSDVWNVYAEVHAEDMDTEESYTIGGLVDLFPKIEIYMTQASYILPNFLIPNPISKLVYYQGIPDPSAKYK